MRTTEFEKLKILIVEDEPESVNRAKAALINTPEKTLLEGQKIELASANFSIKCYKSKDIVEQELKSKRLIPDIAILDIDLSEGLSDDIPDEKRLDAHTSGLDLFESLADYAPNCISTVFTAQLSQSKIIRDRVKKLGLNMSKNLSIKSNIAKSDGEALAENMPFMLLAAAEKIFENLPARDKNELKKQVEKAKEQEEILSIETYLRGKPTQLRYLLMFKAKASRCKKDKTVKFEFAEVAELKKCLNELLALGNDYSPIGIWAKEVMIQAWKDYESGSFYESWQKEIEQKAYALIKQFCENSRPALTKALVYNCLSHVENDEKLNDNTKFQEKFKTALVARRVIIGLFYVNELHKNKVDEKSFILKPKEELAETIYAFFKKTHLISAATFKQENYHLGFSGSYPHTIETGIASIRQEEYHWLKRFEERWRTV